MSSMRKVLQGSASNVARLLFAVLVATVLPPVLVHHLSQAEYSAWVLILQLSTYVNLLDLGLQTVITKVIAENDAADDAEANHRVLSSSFSLLAVLACLGFFMVSILVWRVPQLFHQMPPDLIPKVRVGLLLIGFSAAFALPFNAFSAVFTGLQTYVVPTVLALVSRTATAALLVTLVLLHRDLVTLALAIAAVNVITALAQFYSWKIYAGTRVSFSLFRLFRETAFTLVQSGSVLVIWSLGELFVSGLDLLIVGHFEYAATGFYAIASSATNFMLVVVGSLFSPLLPAVSAMQATRTPEMIGNLTLRLSRYCTLTLCVLSLPLLVGSFPLLSLWVGHVYALKTVLFLQVLVLSNCVRQFCYPYSLVVIAVGKQHLATAAAVAEAVTNVMLSIWLGSRVGAIGVAFGTLGGALVSLGMHLVVSMKYTRPVIDFSVPAFLEKSLLQPLTCTLPLLLLSFSWTSKKVLPARPCLLLAWAGATLLLMYFVGLTNGDRALVQNKFSGLLAKRDFPPH